MKVEVVTLTVDDHDGVHTSVHTSEEAAIRALAENYDQDGEFAALEDGDVVAGLTEHGGICVYFDWHTVEV